MEIGEVQAHVNVCSKCSTANGRVNDFCQTGQILFFDYARDKEPIGIEEVTITDEQFQRLVAEKKRREGQAQTN